jgi:hypothetical protein
MIGSTSSGISDQPRKIYTPYTGAAGMFLHLIMLHGIWILVCNLVQWLLIQKKKSSMNLLQYFIGNPRYNCVKKDIQFTDMQFSYGKTRYLKDMNAIYL